MTIFLPLEASAPFPPSPSFLVPSSEPTAQVKKVMKAIMKARRIAVVCGAGISVQAGIPDFRSSEGLFQTLKKDNPSLASGKDLFDASVFNNESTTSLFCQMIAQLAELSSTASPTAFHQLLRALDNRGRLLRVYTQNIDALESKSGLTFGVPELDGKRYKPRTPKGKGDATKDDTALEAQPGPSRLLTPPVETPRCIPLHGTLELMHCQTCTHSFPLRDHLPALISGIPPYCPECAALEETRQLVGKRSRGVGKLRPSVVLYNELHKDGEEVGDVVRRDLIGSSKGKGRAGADLLLVVGTSLRVPGTKRIVREFSKAVRSRSSNSSTSNGESTISTSGLATPTPSPRRSPAGDEEAPIKTVYLNLDFPVPTREWEGVFDVWIRGDAQAFATMIREEIEKEDSAKEAAIERKRQREAAALAKLDESQTPPAKQGKKRKEVPSEPCPPSSKRRKVAPMSPKTPTKAKKGSKKEDLTLPTKTATSGKTRSRKQGTLTIKIPARSPQKNTRSPPPHPKRRIPEVVIPTTSRRMFATPPPSPPASPLTPVSSSPPMRHKIYSPVVGKRRKGARSAGRPTQTSKPTARVDEDHHVNIIDSGDSELSSLTDLDLQESLRLSPVRTVPYGLRSSGG
ncbi:DHS-like NAD/FAD-binding domain-containing protein [Obba rivulosa]|uniref:DHS-like NAD/FAD-binding domain-containing protein n=1 Tax=Obba rivulosa TaxID=1052685 RepID=A0A8E2DTE0_9APHY|nr:DHS-like NAD/FAD-binding domain-containing protein [Obba rivulosa]